MTLQTCIAIVVVAASCSSGTQSTTANDDEPGTLDSNASQSEPTSSSDAEDFEDPEALALEDGRANVAVELSSAETTEGTFEITAVVSTLSDFADLPEVLFEFAGDAELLEPLPEECSTEGQSIRCQIPGSTVPEDGPTNITINVVPTDEVSITATVTSLNNPVSNDFDPTNNIDTLTLNA